MGASVEGLTNRIVAGLRDEGQDGWSEQVIWDSILEAEKIITNFRPDATSIDVDFVCAAGIQQSLANVPNGSPEALRFLDAKWNGTLAAPTRAIRVVDINGLDRSRPNWRSEPAGPQIREVMFDPREPMVFQNYPSVAAGHTIRVAYSARPSSYGQVDENTETLVSDVFEPMILECAFYRLFGHDVEGSVNISRSQKHWNNFQSMMGIKIEAERVFGPKNPDHKN